MYKLLEDSMKVAVRKKSTNIPIIITHCLINFPMYLHMFSYTQYDGSNRTSVCVINDFNRSLLVFATCIRSRQCSNRFYGGK